MQSALTKIEISEKSLRTNLCINTARPLHIGNKDIPFTIFSSFVSSYSSLVFGN